ncbi:MAG: hypothetical protein IAG13_22740 [Deltaproteobacteria bacterium]|nr:hypothetical protein [Nannocystaceae bacterium]
MSHRSAIVLAVAMSGCPADDGEELPPEDPQPVLLAYTADWARVADPAGDVFADMRPPGTLCDEVMGYGIDPVGFAFEIKTDLCDYLTVRQATLVPLAAGDTIHVSVWHDQLIAPEPTTGYVGFAIDGEESWSATETIPHDVAVLNGDVVVARDYPAGTELQFHVHNHGINSWNLLDVMCTATGAQ